MERARRLYDAGDCAAAVEALAGYRGPDEIFDREQGLLLALARLGWAKKLLETGRGPYAREILEGTATAGIYCGEALERRRLLALSRLEPRELPSLDGELLYRAENALGLGQAARAGRLLDAAEDRESARWNLLRGEAWLASAQYEAAARCLRLAEKDYPREAAGKLEICCRELGDFKGAYEYACRLRKVDGC